MLLAGLAAPTSHAQSESRSVIPVKAARQPSLDRFTDEVWNSATEIAGFRQREPFEGRPGTEKTSVRVLYDKRALYFLITCYDREPRRIVATELRRDGDMSVDDYFTVLISPNHDGRNGYEFSVNPLGTQADSLIGDEGRVSDSNWDGIWSSNARVDNTGWQAVLAIPFSTLNFKTSRDLTVGINFRRFIRRKNEEDLWQSYLRIYGLERVSQAGELAHLEDIGSGRLLVFKPYALTGFRADQVNGSQGLHSGGFDFKYGLRSNMIANVTVNTDFADADIDPQRFNPTPFKIFLPEKRPFFLENSGTFLFGDREGTRLFFSRQIGIDPVTGEQVPLNVGAKLTGSAGPLDLGFMDAQTRESGANPSANYAVGRLKARLFSESYIGVIGIDKESENPLDPYNRAAGADANFVFFRKLGISGFWAKTVSGAPAQRGNDWAATADVTYNSNLIQAEILRAVVQPNFSPEVGFVARTDLVTSFVDFQLSPRPKTGPVREYNFEGFFRYEPDTKGVLQTQEWQATFRALFHNGAYTDDDLADNFIQRLSAPFNIFGNVFIPAGLYHFDRHQFTWGSSTSKRFVYTLFERFGTYYNGTLNEFRVGGTYHPSAHWSLMALPEWDRFKLNNQTYDVKVGSAGASYSFNRFVTTSVLVQLNSVDQNPWSVNVRLRYTYRPDSDLFVIYNVGNQFNSLAAGNPVLLQEKRLSIKLTYSFRR
ncbi:MAG TPA: DUF5916 domain-containing protein [Candidatus Angelobacter sp.]|nr:DUF5916 domain-containing protein [Candidatus Angelobacter sp.]